MDWDSVWRIAKVGGVLIGATLAVGAFTTRLDAVERRQDAMEANGTRAFQVEMRSLRDTLYAIRQDQMIQRYLSCKSPEIANDSFCRDVERPVKRP